MAETVTQQMIEAGYAAYLDYDHSWGGSEWCIKEIYLAMRAEAPKENQAEQS